MDRSRIHDHGPFTVYVNPGHTVALEFRGWPKGYVALTYDRHRGLKIFCTGWIVGDDRLRFLR